MEQYLKQFKKLSSKLGDGSLRANSINLIAGQLITAAALFLFWVLNARLFTANQVGLASAFVSFGVLLATLTNLGLPNTIIRFLPTTKHQTSLFNAAVIFIVVASLIGGLIGILSIGQVSAGLTVVHSSFSESMLLIFLVIGTALNALLDGALASTKHGSEVFKKAIIVAVPRLVLPVFAVAWGVRGMTFIYSVSLIVGCIFTATRLAISIRKTQNKSTIFDFKTLFSLRSYALSNYIGGIFGVLPLTLVPLVVIYERGAAQGAYFYMPLMMAAVVSLVCNAVSQAIIAECSSVSTFEAQRMHYLQGARHLFQYVSLLGLVLGILSWFLLKIYGPAYAHFGLMPLLLLLVSGFFVAFNWLGDTWLNVSRRSRDYFYMNALNSIFVIVAVVIGARHSLIAAAFGWLVGQLCTAILFAIVLYRARVLPLFSPY